MAGGEKREFVDQLVVQSIRKPQSPLRHPEIALIDFPLRLSVLEEEEETGSSVGGIQYLKVIIAIYLYFSIA